MPFPEEAPPFFRGNSIEELPTFIVSIDGREAGRIIETPKRSIEEDLLEIIEKQDFGETPKGLGRYTVGSA